MYFPNQVECQNAFCNGPLCLWSFSPRYVIASWFFNKKNKKVILEGRPTSKLSSFWIHKMPKNSLKLFLFMKLGNSQFSPWFSPAHFKLHRQMLSVFFLINGESTISLGPHLQNLISTISKSALHEPNFSLASVQGNFFLGQCSRCKQQSLQQLIKYLKTVS